MEVDERFQVKLGNLEFIFILCWRLIGGPSETKKFRVPFYIVVEVDLRFQVKLRILEFPYIVVEVDWRFQVKLRNLEFLFTL